MRLYKTDGPKFAAMKTGHAEIHVGKSPAPDKVITTDIEGQNVVQVGLPSHGLLLTLHEGGVVVQFGEAAAKPLTWEQLQAFAEGGELSSRCYGVVCDGTFRAWYPSRAQAEHAAADLRASYGRVELVEIDPDLAERLAK